MFIGGLSLNTTQGIIYLFSYLLETLRQYFEQYGEVSDCVLMIDKISCIIYIYIYKQRYKQFTIYL